MNIYTSLVHYHLLFPPLALLTQPDFLLLPLFPSSVPHSLYFSCSLFPSLLPSFLLTPSFTVFPSLSCSLRVLQFSGGPVVSQPGRKQRQRKEKTEKKKKTHSRSVDSFLLTANTAGNHSLFRTLARFLPP